MCVETKAVGAVVSAPGGDGFVSLVHACDLEMVALVDSLADGLNANIWAANMLDILQEYHTRAHLLGQSKFGLASSTMARGHAVRLVKLGVDSQPEADYLASFLRDILAGDPRYVSSGVIDAQAVLRRMRMYQGKLRGSSGFGSLQASPPREVWKWVLGAKEDHCTDCPYLASLVAVPAGEWYTTPGAGDTPCLWNCGCHMRAEKSGVTTSLPVLREAA